MKQFVRFTAALTLAAFVGLSTAESFHAHRANQTTANCAICQVAHRTPSLVSTVSPVTPQSVSVRVHLAQELPATAVFVFVSHGLSPPTL